MKPVNILESARGYLRRAIELSPHHDLLVGFSAGKDSWATLDLAAPLVRAAGGRLVGWFMYFLPDMDCMRGHMEAARRRYRIDIIQTPHFDTARLLRTAVARNPIRDIEKRVRNVRYIDCEGMAKKLAGIEWVATGQKAIDSLERRGMLKKCNAVNTDQCRVYPLAWWNNTDVKTYNARARLPQPPQFGDKRSSGMGLTPAALRYLKEHWPRDYERVCEVFPLAPSLLMEDSHGSQET